MSPGVNGGWFRASAVTGTDQGMGMTSKGQAEINVTPLIDVLLVLLIIFLVMIPIMTRMETLEIPPPLPPETTVNDPVVIKVEADL